jgi:membrane dipeptidase
MRHALFIVFLLACDKPSVPAPDAAPLASMVAATPSASTSASVAVPPANESLDARAARVHAAAIIVDGHNDIPTKMIDTGFDLGKPDGKTHTDLPRMKAGGITGEFFSIYVDHSYADKPTAVRGGATRRALDLIDVTYQQIDRHPQELVLATNAAGIRAAKRDGKVAVLMGIEGGHAIENSLFALRDFYRLGVRYMTLTHINTNDWADSSGALTPAPARHHGLTEFGKDVVREMQRIGMLVDVSHASDETFFATLAIAKAPIIASHSSSRAVCDARRNLSDDMLRALAKNGGIGMVNFWSRYVDPDFATGKSKVGRFSVLIDHIDHMVKIAGVDHVGLGSDFDGVPELPEGITGIDSLPKITRALLERGYSDDDVWKILGANFLRVVEAAEAYAKSTGTTLSGDGSTRTIAP